MLPGIAVSTRRVIKLFKSHAMPHIPEPSRNPISAAAGTGRGLTPEAIIQFNTAIVAGSSLMDFEGIGRTIEGVVTKGLRRLAASGSGDRPKRCLVIGAGTNNLRRIPLAKTLNDPVFGGSIPEVDSNLVYHVEFAEERTPDYKVTVFEHPRMERADATVKYPEYTGLSEKKIEDTRRISAVEGV